MTESNPNYDADFSSALAQLMEGKYIQGDGFRPGLYAAQDDMGVAAIYDANMSNQRVDNLIVSRGLYQQRFRVFSVALDAKENTSD